MTNCWPVTCNRLTHKHTNTQTHDDSIVRLKYNIFFIASCSHHQALCLYSGIQLHIAQYSCTIKIANKKTNSLFYDTILYYLTESWFDMTRLVSCCQCALNNLNPLIHNRNPINFSLTTKFESLPLQAIGQPKLYVQNTFPGIYLITGKYWEKSVRV